MNIIREVVNIDYEEEMAENTSLGDSRSEERGKTYCTPEGPAVCG